MNYSHVELAAGRDDAKMNDKVLFLIQISKETWESER